ncbi:MAG: type II toxin-antitoxin system VapC family toxin [Hyphomonadaceae bacterium]|nr:type II toxin-antitoxin system VapC family toxin [Hyphomonadaceae bacterium]
MIGLDTNVVVRFLVQDDPQQSALATQLMEGLTRERPGFIGMVVLAEITWVLSRAYKASRQDIANAVEGLLRANEIVVENAEAGYRAVAAYQRAGAGEFADALIAQTASLSGASEIVTFDAQAAKAFGMRALR